MTGIDESTQMAMPAILKIYPNPTKKELTIRAYRRPRSVEIYDVLGKLVRKDIMIKPENITVISTKTLSGGVYFVKVSAEGIEAIKKVVVTK